MILNFSISAQAESYKSEESVYDYAELMSLEEEKELREFSEKFREYNIEVLFLTIADAEGKSSMMYADGFYDTHATMADGVLFMIDMDNRDVHIRTAGKCIEWLDEYDIDNVQDRTEPIIENEEYFRYLKLTSKYAGVYIEEQVKPIYGGFRVTFFKLILTVGITIFVVILMIATHGTIKIGEAAGHYLGSSYKINHKNVVYMGCQEEVLRGYYEKSGRKM